MLIFLCILYFYVSMSNCCRSVCLCSFVRSVVRSALLLVNDDNFSLLTVEQNHTKTNNQPKASRARARVCVVHADTQSLKWFDFRAGLGSIFRIKANYHVFIIDNVCVLNICLCLFIVDYICYMCFVILRQAHAQHTNTNTHKNDEK